MRSRNVRLAAVWAFLKFAARRDLANLGEIENALAVLMKRFERRAVGFVLHEQMLALMFNTGARVSEIVCVRVANVVLGPSNSIRLRGKGRKQRSLPLWKSSARAVHDWLHSIRSSG